MKSDLYGALAIVMLVASAAAEFVGIKTNDLILIIGCCILVTICAASERTDEYVRGVRK